MIFNPLFVSDNGKSQLLVTQPGKLSNNKYLFSDIVKVVMNPGEDQQKISSENVLNGNVNIALEGDHNPIKLQFKVISDSDNEQAKLELADILPEEIAHLLMNEEAILNDEQAISYISKEPLKGELQSFLNGLIGPEIIQKNISNESGLFLNMEDNKSAVNLELVKETGKSSPNDKIIVRTLVVPEKSKLFSLMSNRENNNTLYRVNTNLTNELTNKPVNTDVSKELDNSQITKPTLSVYSFNHSGNKIESLTNTIKPNVNLKQNVKDSGSNQNNTSKIALEKISFIPSDLRKESGQKINPEIDSNIKRATTNELKLFSNQKINPEKDYSVSKITIVKKTNQIESKVNDEIPLKKLEGKINGENSHLQMLVNEKKVKSLKISDTLGTTNREGISKNPNSELKVIVNNSEKLDSPITSLNKQTLEKSNSVIDQNVKTTIKNADSTKTINESSSKIVEDSNGLIKEQSSSAGKDVNKSDLKVPNIKVDNISNADNAKGSQKMPVNNVNIVEEDTNNVSKVVNKSESTTAVNEKVVQKASTDNAPAQPGKSEINKTNVQSEHKSEVEPKENIQSKLASQDKELSKELKSEAKVVNSSPIPELTKSDEFVKNIEKLDSQQVLRNKKVSVKVKGEVKSINDKSDISSKMVEGYSTSENLSDANQKNSDGNSTNFIKNSALFNNPLEDKANNEKIFQQVLNKEEILSQKISNEKASDSNIQSNQRLVKSVELVKEVSKFIARQEKGSLSIDITPEHLGKMKITLDTVDNTLKARIEVDNEQSRQLIEKNLDKLEQELSENGVELNSLNISLGYSKDQQEEKEINNKTQEHSDDPGQVGEVEEEEKRKTLGYNTYEYIA